MAEPTISLRQFRNGRQLKAWLLAGETVDLIERGQVVARIIPVQDKELPARPSGPKVSGKKIERS